MGDGVQFAGGEWRWYEGWIYVLLHMLSSAGSSENMT